MIDRRRMNEEKRKENYDGERSKKREGERRKIKNEGK